MENESVVNLLSAAAVEADGNRLTAQEIEGLLSGQSVSGGGPVHNWRNHLPSAIAENWRSLSQESRLTAFIFAAQAAREEAWELS